MKHVHAMLLSAVIAVGAIFGVYQWQRYIHRPIKVGIIHSMTGTLALSEVPVIDATLLAINQINLQKGIAGRLLEPIVADGASDPKVFAQQAERLIVEQQVDVLFGCWSSASRKEVKPIVEKYNALLVYPVSYEGLEQSPNILYTGPTANQQIVPAISWCIKHIGSTFFLVGSDYIFPRTAHEIIRYEIEQQGGRVVGDEYLLLGSRDVEGVIEKIKQASPQVLLNTINGDTNLHFFKTLNAAGLDQLPVMSFSIAEQELTSYNGMLADDYASWSYFQSIDSPENHKFVKEFQKYYGLNRVVSDPMEAAYIGMLLWSDAVKKSGTTGTDAVRTALAGMSMLAPEGNVVVDGPSQHLYKMARIGKITKEAQFDIVWQSDKPRAPEPFPSWRTVEQWEQFLTDWYTRWGGAWAQQET